MKSALDFIVRKEGLIILLVIGATSLFFLPDWSSRLEMVLFMGLMLVGRFYLKTKQKK
ncbi:hypothetical protein PQU92_07410 [Asticcacaulis sp. BYS171W]|uniref:Uncharacterized protein n=1 Tax=Asticcacaulis aquaticus TaxID=2984212 RepID=A0ABT5HSR9_9CAUL|nr:hypothetical protein [Asticcacaulis aquaticus]MDC7683099.1 hypothetical protein [Asticcacaulis aquaticus]